MTFATTSTAASHPEQIQGDRRAAFETWAKSLGLIRESHGLRSVADQCDVAWMAWEAASSPAATSTLAVGESMPAECSNCGSANLSWAAHQLNSSAVPDGRLRVHEVQCVFALGCLECSETLLTIEADKIADAMTGQRAQSSADANFQYRTETGTVGAAAMCAAKAAKFRTYRDGGDMTLADLLHEYGAHHAVDIDEMLTATIGAAMSAASAETSQYVDAAAITDEVALKVLEEWQGAQGRTMVNRYWAREQIRAMRTALEAALAPDLRRTKEQQA